MPASNGRKLYKSVSIGMIATCIEALSDNAHDFAAADAGRTQTTRRLDGEDGEASVLERGITIGPFDCGCVKSEKRKNVSV